MRARTVCSAVKFWGATPTGGPLGWISAPGLRRVGRFPTESGSPEAELATARSTSSLTMEWTGFGDYAWYSVIYRSVVPIIQLTFKERFNFFFFLLFTLLFKIKKSLLYFLHYHLVPSYRPPSHLTAARVHESFSLFAPSLRPRTTPTSCHPALHLRVCPHFPGWFSLLREVFIAEEVYLVCLLVLLTLRFWEWCCVLQRRYLEGGWAMLL